MGKERRGLKNKEQLTIIPQAIEGDKYSIISLF
jgi:hypothetical protein